MDEKSNRGRKSKGADARLIDVRSKFSANDMERFAPYIKEHQSVSAFIHKACTEYHERRELDARLDEFRRYLIKLACSELDDQNLVLKIRNYDHFDSHFYNLLCTKWRLNSH